MISGFRWSSGVFRWHRESQRLLSSGASVHLLAPTGRHKDDGRGTPNPEPLDSTANRGRATRDFAPAGCTSRQLPHSARTGQNGSRCTSTCIPAGTRSAPTTRPKSSSSARTPPAPATTTALEPRAHEPHRAQAGYLMTIDYYLKWTDGSVVGHHPGLLPGPRHLAEASDRVRSVINRLPRQRLGRPERSDRQVPLDHAHEPDEPEGGPRND